MTIHGVTELIPAKPLSLPQIDHAESWALVLARLLAELGEEIFSAWFGRLQLNAISTGEAHLSVPTKFLKRWIETHYIDLLRAALIDEFGVEQFVISVRINLPPILSIAEAAPSQRNVLEPSTETSANIPPIEGSPLDPRLTFENFSIGTSNRLAHAAAQRIAFSLPGEPMLFNPLYIYGGPCLGKTHLLQAISNAAPAGNRRVIYLTSERFMYGFFAALKAQTAIAFKERLRAIDVLVIDDIQFLQGKSIQQEFCHTLNALIDSRRQIVIACNCPPGDLENLEERVRSRLSGGLCIEIGRPGEQLRIEILEARIAAARRFHPAFEVPAAVIAYVAKTIRSNGRDLDGAVNRLLAHSSLIKDHGYVREPGPITMETAELAIRDLVRTPEPKRVKIVDIQNLVASHFNVSCADILSKRRAQAVARPRQIAMYLAKVVTLKSLPDIGRLFGGRDHTTVLHAVRKVHDMIHGTNTAKLPSIKPHDPGFAEEIELLKRILLS